MTTTAADVSNPADESPTTSQPSKQQTQKQQQTQIMNQHGEKQTQDGIPRKDSDSKTGFPTKTERTAGVAETDEGEEGEESDEGASEEDGEASEAADAEGEKLKTLGAEALLDLGKQKFKAKDFVAAADILSRAVERKLRESNCSELDPSMGVFYLWFGDALLSKEEAADDMLAQIPQAKPAAAASARSSSSSGAEPKEGGEAPDDELAFQMLELAKRCLCVKLDYTPKVAAAAATTGDPQAVAAAAATTGDPQAVAAAANPAAAANSAGDRKEIQAAATDLSFACMRLGDLQLMNNRFEDATQDYAEAVAVRKSFALTEGELLAPKLCLAQATFFSGKRETALTLFKECEALAVRIRDGFVPLPEGTSLKAVAETAEDLAIQISDMQQQHTQTPQQTQQQGSQCEVKSLIPQTTSSFDVPVLGASLPVRKVAVSSAGLQSSASEREGHTPKKRRIDLKALQQQQQQPTAAAADGCSPAGDAPEAAPAVQAATAADAAPSGTAAAANEKGSSHDERKDNNNSGGMDANSPDAQV